jgi:peptide chain release factor subunit 1
MYVDLDPSVFPTPQDRQLQIDGLFDEAVESFANGEDDHEAKKERLAAIDQLRDLLNDDEIFQGGARAIAAFAVPEQDVLEVVRLDEAVPPKVVVDHSPFLRPIVDEGAPKRWAVLLVDGRKARLLSGSATHLEEVEAFQSNTEARTKVGGWSQANYQRHVDEEIHRHIGSAIDTLTDFSTHTPFDGLLIAAPDPTYDLVVEMLDPHIRTLLRGRIKVEIGFSSVDDVVTQARPVIEEARRAAIDDLITSLDERNRDLVAIGPQDVLQALCDLRVETLVVDGLFTLEGRACPSCGWIGLEQMTCPIDSTQTIARSDIIDDAIDLALQQDARVVQVPDEIDRALPAPIGALLRY